MPACEPHLEHDGLLTRSFPIGTSGAMLVDRHGNMTPCKESLGARLVFPREGQSFRLRACVVPTGWFLVYEEEAESRSIGSNPQSESHIVPGGEESLGC